VGGGGILELGSATEMLSSTERIGLCLVEMQEHGMYLIKQISTVRLQMTHSLRIKYPEDKSNETLTNLWGQNELFDY